ncbi:hypothetical protein Tco_0708591 [Tanacetum coccineum]
MDWLSKSKFVIVCHEKVVRIPLEGDEILRVHGERTQGVAKTLVNTKVDEPKLSDISISKEEHEVHLKLVLESPRKKKLYAMFSKSNVLGDALSRKERVKSRRVRGMKLAAQSEAFKQENVLVERLHGSVMDEAYSSRYLVHPGADKTYYNLGEMYCKEWNSGDDQLILRWMIYLVVLADAAKNVRDAIGFEYCLASSSGWTKRTSPVLWAKIGESSLTGLELVQETTDNVVLVKENPKAARDRQKSYVDYRSKPLEFEMGDRVLLKVSNLKKCPKDANLHVLLDEIKVDKTLRFVKEPVEIMD